MDHNISVALRVRPLLDSEMRRGCQSCIDCVPNEPKVVLRKADSDKSFTYNYVFGPESSHADLYDSAVKTLVPKLFEGYNVTILAYGQTGSGKTHSMGTCYNGGGERAIIPQAVCDIFEKIELTNDYEFKVSTSFIELHKDKLFDLLACTKEKPKDKCVVEVRKDASGFFIPGLVAIEVKGVEDTFKSLMMGAAKRATGATAMNAESSRSHAIFTVTIQMCKRDNGNGGEEMVSKFHLVDLAGSESVRKTKATGERFKEGKCINEGLRALGNVINALVKKESFVPYRDSNLTKILKDSLGGNSITLMLACASPAQDNYAETLGTLQYAQRAQAIKNKPIINKDPKAAEIMRLKKENTELLVKGQSAKELSNEIDELKAKNLQLTEANSQLTEANSQLTEANRALTEALHNALSEATNLRERALLAPTTDTTKQCCKCHTGCGSRCGCRRGGATCGELCTCTNCTNKIQLPGAKPMAGVGKGNIECRLCGLMSLSRSKRRHHMKAVHGITAVRPQQGFLDALGKTQKANVARAQEFAMQELQRKILEDGPSEQMALMDHLLQKKLPEPQTTRTPKQVDTRLLDGLGRKQGANVARAKQYATQELQKKILEDGPSEQMALMDHSYVKKCEEM